VHISCEELRLYSTSNRIAPQCYDAVSMQIGRIVELLKAERDLLSRAIDALQDIATSDDEPPKLRRRLMTNATDGIKMRYRGMIPSTRDLARYDEMMRMLASGCTMQAIATHYGLSRQRVHQLLRVKHPDSGVRRAARNPKALPGKCPRCACGLYIASYTAKIGHEC
jgi:hypothetical protein